MATRFADPDTSSTKYTRSAWRDSRNTPGETAVTSSRLSIWRRSSSLLVTAHGESTSESSPIANASGSANASTGRTHCVRLMPQENHTTISESR
ncbi:hypothetical protein D3C83_100370 [compost metagenome]